LTGGSGGRNAEDNPRSGSNDRDLSLNGSVNLSKFLEGPGISLPLSWGWSSSLKKPELKTGSDIVLEDPSLEKSESRSRSVSTSINRTRKSANPFLYYSIDNMNFKVNADQRRAITPTKADTSWSVGMDWRYTYAPRFNTELTVFRDWKVNPLPQSASLSANRKRSEQRIFDIRSDNSRVSSGRTSTSAFNFAMSPLNSRTLTTKYDFSATRDHIYGSPMPLISSVNRGLETSRNHNANVSFTPGFQKYLS